MTSPGAFMTVVPACGWVTDCDRESVGWMLSYLRLGYVPTCGHHGVDQPITAVIAS